MLQRLIAAVLSVLGLAAIAFGVGSATLWRAEDTLVASARPSADGTLVATAPGVLELGGGAVTVAAEAVGGTKVVLAIGKEPDVAGWVGSDAHTLLTGLADGGTLSTRAVEGTGPAAPDAADAPDEAPVEDGAQAPAPAPAPEPTPAPDPDGSDLWVQQATGETTAELTWTPEPGRWTLLAAGVGEGAQAPVVRLSWPQTVTTPWLVPGLVVGGLLLVTGLVLGARAWRRGRGPAGPSTWHPVDTGATPVVVASGSAPLADTAASGVRALTPGPQPTSDERPTVVLTRRQLREAAAAAAAATPAATRPRLPLRFRAQAGGPASAAPESTPPEVAPREAAPPGSAARTNDALQQDALQHGAPRDDARGSAERRSDAFLPAATEPVRAADQRRGTGSSATTPQPVAPQPAPARPSRTAAAPTSVGRRGTLPEGAPSSAPSRPDAPRTPPVAGSGAAGPGSSSTAPAGSRADAWRRAWGVPGATGAEQGAPGPAEAPDQGAAAERHRSGDGPGDGPGDGRGAGDPERRGKDS
ncbi:hypothetical protein [Cellulomonas fimi]|uniref:Uncharacterized protein n=1 Tax=Cellulomonas fimi TaxID=1708 RepID=A0A7Y0QHJ6_CELFI|nr:hypothetical protein [Cellulomonas fimi]NMR19964.1 hypothetical protein [Cellulomonas fimi]